MAEVLQVRAAVYEEVYCLSLKLMMPQCARILKDKRSAAAVRGLSESAKIRSAFWELHREYITLPQKAET